MPTSRSTATPTPTPASTAPRPGRREPRLRLTRREAAALATVAQGLDRRPAAPTTPKAWSALLLETIRRMGAVQIDTISVISRTQETVLWSRLGPYDPALLADLHHPRGELLEYWGHALALVPVEWFPCFRPYMAWWRERHSGPDGYALRQREVIDAVRARIAADGPTGSRDFDAPDGPRPGPWVWYGAKPERQALDWLFTVGETAVVRREGFHRKFDLVERVLPPALVDARLPEEEIRSRFVRHALRALGIGSAAWVTDYFRSGNRAHVPARDSLAELRRLEEAGDAVPVEVEDVKGPLWLDPGLLDRLDDLRAGLAAPELTTILTPFDNLVWNRPRTAALWDFHYRMQSYVPAADRTHGYYPMPILHRGDLVGRIDLLLDRKAGTLAIRALTLEPRVDPTAALFEAVGGAVADLSRFLRAGEILVDGADPALAGPVAAAARGA